MSKNSFNFLNSALDRQISEIEEKINAQHRQMGGVHNSHQRHVTTQVSPHNLWLHRCW